MRILIVVLLVLPLFAIAQQQQQTTRKKFSMGLSFAPGLSYRSLKYSDANQWIADQRNDEEVAKVGFSAGVNLFFCLNTHITVETGLQYANRGEMKKKQDLIWTAEAPSSPGSAQVSTGYQFFDIPLKVNYQFSTERRLNYYVNAGFLNSIFLRKKTTVESIFSDGDKKKSSSYDKLGYTPICFFIYLGVGAEYDITKRLSLRVEPNYVRSLNSVVQDENGKTFLYGFQLNASVRLFFFK
jgi:hypothetical protein